MTKWLFQTHYREDGSFRLPVWLVKTLAEKMVLSDLSREKMVLFDLSRLLVRRWFCQSHWLTSCNTWWEGGSARLTVWLVTALDRKMALAVKTLAEKWVLSDSLAVLLDYSLFDFIRALARKWLSLSLSEFLETLLKW